MYLFILKLITLVTVNHSHEFSNIRPIVANWRKLCYFYRTLCYNIVL